MIEKHTNIKNKSFKMLRNPWEGYKALKIN